MKPEPCFAKPLSWWDDFFVPKDVANSGPDVLRQWLEANTPDPMEHEFILYTDGSGCTAGWGAYAATYEEIDGGFEIPRFVSSRGVRIGGTYGSTVQRCELTAFLDGIHAILDRVVARSEAEEERLALQDLTGDRRISVCWFTDRMNLARALMFSEAGNPLDSRAKDRDLWLRFSAFARHVCVTPRPMPRNEIGIQKRMDAVCDTARAAMKQQMVHFAVSLDPLIDILSWTEPKSQKARF